MFKKVILISLIIIGAFVILIGERLKNKRIEEQFIELTKMDPSKEELGKPMNLWCIQMPEGIKIKK